MGGKDGGFLTAKAIGNRIKAKGLQKLRWYCQMCQKQCRDENGFKCHCASEGHQRQMMLFADNTKKYLSEYSSTFHAEFMKLLSVRYGTRRVHANVVYQEYIADKTHLHMNATVWMSLTAYVKYLGREGICEVDETEKGFFIRWIDRSPETLAKQEAVQKQLRLQKSEEERERALLQEQVERAKSEAQKAEADYTELKRDEGTGPIKLALKTSTLLTKPIKLAPKKLDSLASKSLSSSSKSSNPLASSSSSSSASKASTSTAKRPMNAMEAIILEEQSRKKRRDDRR